MVRSALTILIASSLAFGTGVALARGGGGGPGGMGGPPGIGSGGVHGAGLPSPGSPPGAPSLGAPPHAPLSGLPNATPPHSPPSSPHHGKAHASKSKAHGLNRAMSRMSPQGKKNTNNPLSPNRAHGRARAEDRHALLDRPGRQ